MVKQVVEILKKTNPKAIPPAMAKDSFDMLVQAYREYKEIVEMETTKRQAISAWRDTKLAALENQREILKDYLARTFEERNYVINEMFERLDVGIADNNMELVNMAMDNIVAIVKTSPLKEAEKVISALHDPNVGQIEF